jgi:hypothetical protein
MHEIVLDEFVTVDYPLGSTDPKPHLVVHSARATGISRPITGEAADTPGAYFIAIPVTRFDNIRYSDADVTLRVGGKSFRLHIAGTDLDAFNGAFDGRVNELVGQMSVNGTPYSLPVSPDDTELDPEYEQAHFDSMYVCYDNLAEPVPVP